MKNVSNDFLKTMEERLDFYCYAEITFLNGEKKTLQKSDFNISGNSIAESPESNSFPIGLVVSKQITLSLVNHDDRWSEYDFYGAKIVLSTKFDLNTGLTETINVGTFTVITPETYGTTVEISATDDSYKLDKEYNTNLSYPMTIGEAVRDSCAVCGVSLLTTTFNNYQYTVTENPEGITHRNFIGLCAMIAGGNAIFDENNRLKIMTYDFSEFEKSGLDGGIFDVESQSKYETGDTAGGGSFNPWNNGANYDGGTFLAMKGIHVLSDFKSGISIETDDVVITGVKLTAGETDGYLYGADGYVLSLENVLALGQEKTVAALIGQKIVGLSFRPFSGDHVAYPLADFMDLAVITDIKQNVYKTIITDINFSYFGFTTLKCSADSPLRNSSKYNSNKTKAIVAARKETKKQITEYDKSVQMLANLISQSFGVFKTEEVLPDGSTIFYLHNKPTLAESSTIWKMTADAFAVSTNGGQTWNAGIDSSGNAVVNVLSAIGINFDWARGGTLTLGGNNNANGVLRILNASGVQIGEWGKDGINASNGTFSGELNGATGTFSGEITSQSGKIGPWIIAGDAIYNGIPYTGQANSNSTGIGDYGGNWAFWAGNGRFSVNQSGHVHAEDIDASGNINAKSGTFDSVTIRNSSVSSSSLSGTAGLMSGGTYSGPTISGGLLGGSTGGTYVGTCSGSTLSSCSTGGTTLGLGSNNSVFSSSGARLYGSTLAYLEGGSNNLSIGAGHAYFNSSTTVHIQGGFTVAGSKSRNILTENYGNRCLDALETPSPTFSDFGKATLDKNGECHIAIDPIFAETVNETYMPVVFLTKYGQGDLWVDEERSTHDIIVICGTPNLSFAWETRYQQTNCYQGRLRISDFDNPQINEHDYPNEANVAWEQDKQNVNYGNEGCDYYEQYERSLIT